MRLAAGIGRQRSPEDPQEGFLPAIHLRCHSSGGWAYQQPHWLLLCKSWKPSFYVTRKSPGGKREQQSIIQMCFATCHLLCRSVWLWGDGLTSELFINAFQPAWVGPQGHSEVRSWKHCQQFSKYGSQLGELCPLKGNMVLTHTPQASISKGWKKADSRLLN